MGVLTYEDIEGCAGLRDHFFEEKTLKMGTFLFKNDP